MTNSRNNKIICLETADWDGATDKTTVEPILDLLAKCREIEYTHRDVATRPELEHYLSQYSKLSSWDVLYLAFHGPEQVPAIDLDDAHTVELPELAEIMARVSGFTGRLVYFSSCYTMKADGDELLEQFLKKTGAAGVCGYTADPDWIDSAALDLLALSHLPDYPFTRQGLKAFKKRLREMALGLCCSAGFRLRAA